MLGSSQIDVDGGFVRLVDTMGDDSSIVQAARVSYGSGTKTTREDAGLIRYLMRHRHTTPFEMCEIKLHIKCPIFIARQWLRHRTANVNEMSGRYSVIEDEFWVPSEIRSQSGDNLQATFDVIENHGGHIHSMKMAMGASYGVYRAELEAGVCREQARAVLPQSMYTQFYWKIDLHNLLHFLRLRIDSHAQKEIRVFAEAIADVVREWVPVTWSAFDDYVLGAVTFSKREIAVMRGEDVRLSAGERRELAAKRKAVFGVE